MKIPILVDAEQERTKEELEDLLSVASYIVCSGKFPKVLSWYISKSMKIFVFNLYSGLVLLY